MRRWWLRSDRLVPHLGEQLPLGNHAISIAQQTSGMRYSISVRCTGLPARDTRRRRRSTTTSLTKRMTVAGFAIAGSAARRNSARTRASNSPVKRLGQMVIGACLRGGNFFASALRAEHQHRHLRPMTLMDKLLAVAIR